MNLKPNFSVRELAKSKRILLFIAAESIKNEQGLPIEFIDRAFLIDIYRDKSANLCVLKAPQIGLTTLMVIKTFWTAKYLHKDIIYTLPTQSDVQDMASGKINRIVAQNQAFRDWIKDHDSVESKQVGTNTIYYRGTWTSKAAMMVASQLNVHDEVDASKDSVIEQYETRLQATADGWRWYFSHPSLPDFGIDKYWQISDQKHWFVECPECGAFEYLEWPQSVNFTKRCFQCKKCHAELSDDDRRNGQWVAKFPGRQFSGYWVSQLMCPWITADKILTDFTEKTPEYFYNYVLGLPYAGGDAKLTKEALFQNLTGHQDLPDRDERVILGVDTGAKIDFVLGNARLGLFHHGDSANFAECDEFMKKWPLCIAVIDAGGEQIVTKEFCERWPGRAFIARYKASNDGEIFKWGEQGQVYYDLDKAWQLVVDEFRTKRIPLQGTEDMWWEYWLDWKNMSRKKLFNKQTGMFEGIEWVRSGRNHRASATLFWRIGMSKFSQGMASFLQPGLEK